MIRKPCERCNNAERAVEHEFCHECIHEMIVPGYSPQIITAETSEELRREIRRSNGFD